MQWSQAATGEIQSKCKKKKKEYLHEGSQEMEWVSWEVVQYPPLKITQDLMMQGPEQSYFTLKLALLWVGA